MRRPRALALKVAAPQEARLVVQPVVRQAVQPVEPQVVQQVVPLVVQPEPVRQAQLEPRVLLEPRVPQARLRARLLVLLARSAWSVR